MSIEKIDSGDEDIENRNNPDQGANSETRDILQSMKEKLETEGRDDLAGVEFDHLTEGDKKMIREIGSYLDQPEGSMIPNEMDSLMAHFEVFTQGLLVDQEAGTSLDESEKEALEARLKLRARLANLINVIMVQQKLV